MDKYRLIGLAIRAASALLVVGVLVVVVACMAGCAVGRDPLTGAVVLGVDAGRLVEDAPQALAGLLPGPMGQLAGFAATAFIGHQAGRNRGWDERESDALKKRGSGIPDKLIDA